MHYRYSVICFFLLSFFPVKAQDTVRNPFTGKCVIWRSPGWSRVEGHLWLHRKFGKWKFFDNEGKLHHVAHYRSDKLQGRMTEYDSDQRIEWHYSKDVLQGETRMYYLTGELSARLQFVNGEQEGLQTRYFTNGNISEISIWSRSRKEGMQLDYYPDGILRSKIYFHDGRKTGKEEQYRDWPFDKTPVRYYSGSNDFGLSSGLASWYYVSGAVYKTSHFESGRRQGEEITFDEKGNKLRIRHFVHDLKHGTEERYDASGHLLYRMNWGDDLPQDEFTIYQINGQLRDSGTYVNGKVQGRRVIYYPSGKRMMQADLADGVLNGPSVQFDEKGKILLRGNYTDGKRSGEWHSFYPNDSLRSIAFYLNGIPDSTYTRYAANGKEIFFARYRRGALQGKPVIHDENGKLLDEKEPEFEAIALSSRPSETYVDESLLHRQPDFERYRRELIEYSNAPERLPQWQYGWENWNDSIASVLPDSLKPSPKFLNDTVWYLCTIDANGRLEPRQKITASLSGGKLEAVKLALVSQKNFTPGERFGIADAFDLPLPVVMRSPVRKKKIDFRKLKTGMKHWLEK